MTALVAKPNTYSWQTIRIYRQTGECDTKIQRNKRFNLQELGVALAASPECALLSSVADAHIVMYSSPSRCNTFA